MKGPAFLLATVSLTAFFAGCSNPPAPPSAAAADPAAPPRVIAKGMSADEILRRIGKPTEVRPIDSPEGQAEIWIYRRPAGHTTQQTAATVHEIPVVNPYTGVIRMLNEPTYSLDTVDLLESTSLLIYNGKMVEWKRAIEGKRVFE